MNARLKVAAALVGLVTISVLGGAYGGACWAFQKARKRSIPEQWHLAVMRTLEKRLHFTPEQKHKVEAIIEGTVVELKAIRLETIEHTNSAIERAIERIDEELTPEQRTVFAKLKAERGETTLDMLKVEPRKPPVPQ